MQARQHDYPIVKKLLGLAVCIILTWTVLFALEKPVFLLVYQHSLSSLFPVVAHGLTLDFTMAGYLSALPLLLLTFGAWIPQRLLYAITSIYYVFASLAYAMSFVANLALYGYWRFPLDSTPVFYFLSSPADAVASVSWWVVMGAVLLVVVIVLLVGLCFIVLYNRWGAQPSKHPSSVLVMVLLSAALFLPIRGGVTVSSANTGKVYFSEKQLLNHAAVNPLFSFFESVTHAADFAGQCRFMDDSQACHWLSLLNNPRLDGQGEVVLETPSGTKFSTLQAPANNVSKKGQGQGALPDKPSSKIDSLRHISLLRPEAMRPDIYIIILESFSDTILHVPNVTPNLNRLRREGVYFPNFYANGFRTDRGLVSILQGFPAPGPMSLMKYPKKTSSLSSIAAHLKKAGYQRNYYYGGDADFTNMRSFLISQGFENIMEDVDFPITERLSKWGVPDHLLFRKVEKELSKKRVGSPSLNVIQTSSSHEPYDVAYHHLPDERLNAFAYTDSCVGGFIKYLKASPKRWERSVVILVPDHWGSWPENTDDNHPWRHHIPLIWVGGALNGPAVVHAFGSQQDIAATLLGQLGLTHADMPFSKDMLDPTVSHYAFFMMHDGEGLVTRRGAVMYDNRLSDTIYAHGSDTRELTEQVKAYAQKLFDYIAQLTPTQP